MLDDLWVPEGSLLGVRLKVGTRNETIWWRLLGREFADYTYSFASTVRGSTTGWIDLQDANSNYILNPIRQDVVNQFYVGVYPAGSLLYLQYPSGIDRNALTGYRPVDSSGNGALRGRESPIDSPSRKSELWTIHNLRPRMNIYNDYPLTIVAQVRLYAMMYSVEGPFVAGDPEIGDRDYLRKLLDDRKAKLTSIYGVDPVAIPSEFMPALAESRNRANNRSTEAESTAPAFASVFARV